jgi:tetratricopeptide (TPR) repeat protein
MSATGEKFIPPEIEKQLSNVDEQGKVIDPSQASISVKESWVTARKSFYQRDYEKSIQSYQDVIDNTEDNFDAYGELGNVYFNQGKKQQAASAYFEAAAILIKKGQVNRAQSLMGLLRHLDKAKAEELQALIESARS